MQLIMFSAKISPAFRLNGERLRLPASPELSLTRSKMPRCPLGNQWPLWPEPARWSAYLYRCRIGRFQCCNIGPVTRKS